MAMNLGTAVASIRLDASDLLANSARAQQALQNLDRSVSGTLDRTGRAMINTGAMLTRRVTVPLTLAGGYMLKTAGDFEAGMNKVLAITDATGAQFDMLRGQAIDLSRTTRWTATEITDGMSFLAMAGFEVNEIYAAMPGMLDLAAAGSLNLGHAADIVSNIMQGMGIEATETTRVVDVLTSAFTGSNVTVEMLGESFRYVATAARQAGWDIEQTTAVIGLLGNAGIQASMAGTSMRNWIVRLTAQTPKAAKALDALGVSTHNLDGSLKSPLDLVREFEGAMDRWGVSIDGLDINNLTSQFEGMEEAVLATGMSIEDFDAMEFADQLDYLNAIGYDTSAMMDSAGNSAEFLAAVFDIFGLRGAPAFLALLQQGSGALETFTDRLYNAAGTASRVAETMMRGLRGSLLILKSAWEAWMIQLGDAGALDFATRAVQGLTRGIEFLSEMSDASRRRLLLFLGAAMALGPGLVILGAGLRAVAFLMRTLGFSSILGNLVRLSPLLAAAGLGFLAWRNNLFGIQTIVRRLTPALRQFGRVWSETFGRSRDQGDTVMVAALKATGNALVSIAPLFGRFGETVRDVGLWFREAGVGIDRLAYNFRQFRDHGVNPVSAALMSLGVVFPQLEGALRPIVVAFDQFRQGDYAGMFRTIAESLRTMAVSLGTWVLDVGVPTVTGWIVDAAGDAWGAISAAAGWVWDGLVTLGSWVLETAAPAVGGWLATASGNVWDAISTAAGWVWDGAVELGNWVLNVAAPQIAGSASAVWEAIKGWVIGETGGVLSLPSIAVTVGDWIVSATESLIDKIDTFIFGEAGDREFTIPVINVTVGRVNVLPFADKIQEAVETAVLAWETAQEVHADIEEIRIRAGGARLEDPGGGGNWFMNYLQGEIQAEIDHAAATWEFIMDLAIVTNAEVKDPDSTYNQVVDLIGDMAGGWGMLHGGTVDWDFVLGEPEILGFGLIDVALWIDEHIYQPVEDAFNGLKDKFTFDIPDITINWPDMPEPPDWMTEPPQWWTNIQEGRLPWDNGGAGSLSDAANDLEDSLTRIAGLIAGNRLWQIGQDLGGRGGGGGGGGWALPALSSDNLVTSLGQAEEAVRSGLGNVGAAIRNAAAGWAVEVPPIEVTAETDMAVQGMMAVQDALAGIDGTSSTVQVLGENAGALAAVAGAESALGGIAGRTAQTFVNGDNTNALGAIMGAAAALAGFDGTTGTAYLNAIDNVSGAVSSALAAVRSLDGATATAYINVVSSGSGIGGRIPGFASGGYVHSPYAIVGEKGPELVSLPYGSYVHTAAETAAMLAQARATPYMAPVGATGGSVSHTTVIHAETHIAGNVIGNEDFADDLAARTAWRIASVKQRRDLAKGMVQ